MSVNILQNKEGRQKVIDGINKAADAVKQTLGGEGRFVIYSDIGWNPVLTKDGATVAAQIELEDPAENYGAQFIRQASKKAERNVADGTTTTSVILQSLVNEGEAIINGGEASPSKVIRGLNDAEENIISKLDEMSTEVTDQNLYDIAKVSANGDDEVAELVSSALISVGEDNVVLTYESSEKESSIEIMEGYKIDESVRSDYSFTNGEVNLGKAKVLLTDYVIKDVMKSAEFIGLVNEMISNNQSLVIIANDFGYNTYNFLAQLNTGQYQDPTGRYAHLPNCLIKAPNNYHHTEFFDDIAPYIGATLISESRGVRFEDFKLEHLGEIDELKGTFEHTFLKSSNTDVEKYKDRKTFLEGQLRTQYDGDKVLIRRRLSALNGKTASIFVGGHTRAEIKEKMDRVQDAKGATRAAMKEGYIVGAGKALYSIAKEASESGELSIGEQLAYFACMSPFNQILKNADIEDSDLFSLEENSGYNVKTRQIVDLIEEGIIDPVMVTKSAVRTAFSIAKTILNTGAVIVNKT